MYNIIILLNISRIFFSQLKNPFAVLLSVPDDILQQTPVFCADKRHVGVEKIDTVDVAVLHLLPPTFSG